ncbi:MAG: NAD(P)H-dependent oxidoreductase [Alphaproteobacteria bacterium]|nr:NAD(P)H-dependent oxidoreductase [Alphaproteobacteria bacterium]
MGKRIAIIDGHPDPEPGRFGHALAQAYAEGALAAGHEIRRVDIAALDVGFLRSARSWESDAPTPDIAAAQEAIGWAEHLVIVYPLWLGAMPALLKAFFEQAFRPGFAIAKGKRTMWPGLLNGRSARIVVTMGMPALLYRWYFLAHSLRSLERNILRFSGIGPIRETLIGRVEASAERRARWLDRLRALGRAGR